jgi:hypothetical protein
MTEAEPATESGTDAPAPRTSGWLRLALGMVAGGTVAAALALVLVFPYLRDDWVLDGIVKAVALDWRDFGEAKARERLQYELDARDIGTHVRDDACDLTTRADGAKQVGCAWSVQLAVPGAGRVLPLSFTSVAVVLPDGDLR